MDHIDKLVDSVLSEETFKKGDRVRVSGGSGIVSTEKGIVVDRSEVKTDGRSIPTNVQGAYKPVDWSKEVAVKLDSGDLITMFKSRLTKVNQSIESEIQDFVYDSWEDAGPEFGGEEGGEATLEQFRAHVMDRLSDRYGDTWDAIRPVAKKIVDTFNG